MGFWWVRLAPAVALSLCLLTSTMATAGEPLTEAEFRDRFVQVLATEAPELRVRIISETELGLTRGDGEEGQQYLGNAYRQYRANPEALEEVLARFARVSAQMGMEELPVEASSLMVLVRSEAFVDEYRAMMKSKGAKGDGGEAPRGDLLYRPLPGGLVEIVAIDTPDAYKYPPVEDVTGVTGTVDKAWPLARDNTLRLIGEANGEEIGAGLILLTTSGSGGSSLMAVDDFWQRTEAAAKLGPPIVFMVSRDAILMTFADHEEGLLAMKIIARGLVEEPGEFDEPILSPALLIRTEGGWKLFSEYPYQ